MIEYERFRIPPDFNLVKLHKQASYLYDENSKAKEICPCCEKFIRQKKIPFSAGTQSLTQLGQQIPMLFYFLKATSIFLFCLVIAKFADYQICNMIEKQCEIIYASFVIPQVGTVDIPAGFKQANDALSFAQFMVFILGIIGLKIAIKIKKYKVKELTKQSISNRTLKLINVHKQCSIKQIKQALQPYKIEVVLTYRVKQFQECLLNINKLLKMKIMKKQKDGSFIQETQRQIDQKMARQKQTLLKIKKNLKIQKNRLSIAFVIFTSSAQKRQAYKKFKRTLIGRLFFKLCTCCSETEIRGQSFTVKPADAPSDIIWINLQNPYLRTKIRRLLSVFVCFILLMFGVATEYLFTQIANQNTFVGPLVKSVVVLVLNFIIVSLLEYSTQNMEHYESHTQRHLTLVKKMTAFLFINISLSPLLGYAFSLDAYQKQEEIRNILFANFCFSVLVLAIGNITKPFPLWFSVQRVIRLLTQWLNKRKGKQCILTQIEANKQFQPIEFPISTLYSLALSSLLMVCFYVNVFQILILVEMVSLVILFLVGKWMLLRVCKSSAGLARRINNLAQSLLRIVILIYWLGKVLLNYVNLNEDQKLQYDSIIDYTFRNSFGYIEFIFTIVCAFFLQFFVAWVSVFILGKMNQRKTSKKTTSEQRLLQNKKNQRDEVDEFQETYANANLHLKLEDEFKKFEQSQKEIKKKQKKREQKYFR